MKSYPLLRQDLFAWCLAAILPPLWIVLYLNFPQAIAGVIYMVVALVWVLLDRINLMKQGITPPSWLWFPLHFVYLRQRDQSQGKPWRLLQVWLLCTLLSLVAIYQFKKTSGTATTCRFFASADRHPRTRRAAPQLLAATLRQHPAVDNPGAADLRLDGPLLRRLQRGYLEFLHPE